ncbi:MAG: hypothetical protein J7518_08150 [Nocardioidaceae bacterium]|nr:hypothetical protein [Nocardioidaceae bacterium]
MHDNRAAFAGAALALAVAGTGVVMATTATDEHHPAAAPPDEFVVASPEYPAGAPCQGHQTSIDELRAHPHPGVVVYVPHARQHKITTVWDCDQPSQVVIQYPDGITVSSTPDDSTEQANEAYLRGFAQQDHGRLIRVHGRLAAAVPGAGAGTSSGVTFFGPHTMIDVSGPRSSSGRSTPLGRLIGIASSMDFQHPIGP